MPERGTVGLIEEEIKTLPDDFLAGELRQRVAPQPVAFDFKPQLAAKDDQLTDPTRTWPDSRPVITAGKSVIDQVEAAQGGACDRTTFIPLVPPTGIEPSADPVLLARPAPYAVSVGRRLAEGAK